MASDEHSEVFQFLILPEFNSWCIYENPILTEFTDRQNSDTNNNESTDCEFFVSRNFIVAFALMFLSSKIMFITGTKTKNDKKV